MGTTQDFAVAVEEGATIVRVGTRLLHAERATLRSAVQNRRKTARNS